MDPNESIQDMHTLFLTNTSNASREQMNDALEEYFKECSRFYNIEEKTWKPWYINVIQDKIGQRIGVIYVHFQNPQAYHILTGCSIDGSLRKKRVSIDEAEEMGLKIVSSSSWDEGAIEEPDDGQVTVIDEDPELPFPEVITNDRNTGAIKNVTIKIQKCLISKERNEDECYYPNILFGFLNKDDFWVKDKDIYEYFIPYCHGKRSRQEMRVTIEGPKIFVRFLRGTNDAHFALVMNKKLIIEEKGGSRKATIFFGYAKKR